MGTEVRLTNEERKAASEPLETEPWKREIIRRIWKRSHSEDGPSYFTCCVLPIVVNISETLFWEMVRGERFLRLASLVVNLDPGQDLQIETVARIIAIRMIELNLVAPESWEHIGEMRDRIEKLAAEPRESLRKIAERASEILRSLDYGFTSLPIS